MSTPLSIPTRFEDYLLSIRAERQPQGVACEGCFRTDLAVWLPQDAGNPMTACEACLRERHGGDVEEEQMVHAILGGAIRAALEQGASRDLIRAAVQHVLDEDLEREGREWGRWEGRLEAGAVR